MELPGREPPDLLRPVSLRDPGSRVRQPRALDDHQRGHRRSGHDPRVPADAREQPAVLPGRPPLRLPAVLLSRCGRHSAVRDGRERPPPLAVGNVVCLPAHRDRALHVHAVHVVRRGRPPGQPLLSERLSGVAVPDAAARLGRTGAGCLGRRCALHRAGARQSLHRREAAVSHRRTRPPAGPCRSN